MRTIAKWPVSENRFRLVWEGVVTAPDLTDRPMADFFRRCRRQFSFMNPALGDDAKFPVRRDIAGKSFMVKIYQPDTGYLAPTRVCVDFLQGMGAVMLGAQGAAMLHEQHGSRLPTDLWMLFFGEEGGTVPRLYYQSGLLGEYTRASRNYQRPHEAGKRYSAFERLVRRITGADRPVLNLGKNLTSWKEDNAIVAFIPME